MKMSTRNWNSLLVAVGLVIMGFGLNAVNTRPVAAQGPPVPPTASVTVVNTNANPVPVSGNVNIGGTVSISGTPTFAEADNPGRNPFQAKIIVSLDSATANDSNTLTVPAGKRAVIEHVAVLASGPDSPVALYTIAVTIGTGTDVEIPISGVAGAAGVFGIASQPLRAFANPGTQLTAIVRRSITGSPLIASFVITGYFVPAT